MSKRVYISADYDTDDRGDTDVVNILNKWATDNLHSVNFVDMAKVASGSVSKNKDCRSCELKREFNIQINVSSICIFIVGDKTSNRKAGSYCFRATKEQSDCTCTPYKKNALGEKACKVVSTSTPGENDDIGNINTYAYLEHEFKQSIKKNKNIIILYNSMIKQSKWLPSYMSEYKEIARPFWRKDENDNEVGDYQYIKEALGF